MKDMMHRAVYKRLFQFICVLDVVIPAKSNPKREGKMKRSEIKQCQEYPCADCEDIIEIGSGEGLCNYCDHLDRKFIVPLFEVYPYCPKARDGRTQ